MVINDQDDQQNKIHAKTQGHLPISSLSKGIEIDHQIQDDRRGSNGLLLENEELTPFFR